MPATDEHRKNLWENIDRSRRIGMMSPENSSRHIQEAIFEVLLDILDELRKEKP